MASQQQPGAAKAPAGDGDEEFGGVVVVELGDDRNRTVMWEPEQRACRGRWSRSNLLPDEMIEQVMRMPDIPGIRVRVDGRRRRLELFDPLGAPENAALLAE